MRIKSDVFEVRVSGLKKAMKMKIFTHQMGDDKTSKDRESPVSWIWLVA